MSLKNTCMDQLISGWKGAKRGVRSVPARSEQRTYEQEYKLLFQLICLTTRWSKRIIDWGPISFCQKAKTLFDTLGQAGLVYQIEALTCYGGKTTYFTCVWTKMLWQEQCCLLDGLSMSVLWRATSWKYRERGGQPIRGLRCENMGGATSIYQTVRRIVLMDRCQMK